MRYSVGESPNFIMTPMLTAALDQLLAWQPEQIQAYCASLMQSPLQILEDMGCILGNPAYTAKHLFGIRMSKHFNLSRLNEAFAHNNVHVSVRGDAIRVSPNVYNTERDVSMLIESFREARM